MKVLIVEDDKDKSEAIKSYLESIFNCEVVAIKESITSGLHEIIINNNYDWIALDMSMPSYDICDDDPTGGGSENFGGYEFLEQMLLREISIPTIVISQFSSFGGGSQRKTLSSLDHEFELKFKPFYKGAIFYTTANKEWKTELNKKISELNL